MTAGTVSNVRLQFHALCAIITQNSFSGITMKNEIPGPALLRQVPRGILFTWAHRYRLCSYRN